MAVQKVSGTIDFQGSSFTVNPFSEVHLFSIAEFIQNLKEASTTPDKWYAIASLLADKCPKLLSEGYIEINQLEKTGDLFLNAKQLQELYSGLFSLWENNTTVENFELDKTAADVPSETIADLEARIAQMKATSVEVKEGK